MDLVCAGRCFFLAETPQDQRHLWIVLTNPDGNPPEVVAVMLRTAKHYTDPTVVLQVGDHPFISRPSSVHYSTAQRFRVSEIIRLSARQDCGIQPDLPKAVLAKVQAGLAASPYVVPSIRTYCEWHLP
jgi:hypothetical protein